MNLSDSIVLPLSEKVLKDLDYWRDDIEPPLIKYIEKGDYAFLGDGVPTWLAFYSYKAEDIDKGDMYLSLLINDDDGLAKEIIYCVGNVKLGYDKENDKYFIDE